MKPIVAAAIVVCAALASGCASDPVSSSAPPSSPQASAPRGSTSPPPAVATDPSRSAEAQVSRSPLECSQTALQGGLIVCRTLPLMVVTLDGHPIARADLQGLAVVGLPRDQPPIAVIGLAPPLDQPAPFGVRGARAEVMVSSRTDGVSRFVMACGKIAPQTDEETRHAQISEGKKSQALKGVYSPSGDLSFILPARGRTSSPFGAVRTYVPDNASCQGRTSVHNGLDIAVPTGTEVIAPAAGVVLLADPDLYFEGGAVFIDHGRGLLSVLMHMSRVDARTGDQVVQGQPIGLSGATGRVTGPHVHWGLKFRKLLAADRDQDLWIDPSLALSSTAGSQ